MSEEEILMRAEEIQLQRQKRKLEQDIRSRINFGRGGYRPNEVYELLLKFAKDHGIAGLDGSNTIVANQLHSSKYGVQDEDGRNPVFLLYSDFYL